MILGQQQHAVYVQGNRCVIQLLASRAPARLLVVSKRHIRDISRFSQFGRNLLSKLPRRVVPIPPQVALAVYRNDIFIIRIRRIELLDVFEPGDLFRLGRLPFHD
ncbi:hypothetical protein D1872_213780 [compost metagenome]